MFTFIYANLKKKRVRSYIGAAIYVTFIIESFVDDTLFLVAYICTSLASTFFKEKSVVYVVGEKWTSLYPQGIQLCPDRVFTTAYSFLYQSGTVGEVFFVTSVDCKITFYCAPWQI